MSEPAFLRTTRAAYDTVAVDYAELVSTELDTKPLDRALLATFAEVVRADGGGPVADLGCGPGRVTAHLHALDLDASGIDLSGGMIAEAQRRHPQLRFDQGSLTSLPLADGALAGALAWYSVIHTPPSELPGVVGELHRVLAPGGHLLMAFQAGDDEHLHREQAYGHQVPLDSYRHSPDRVVALLTRSWFDVHTRVIREPAATYETYPQAYLLARRPRAPQTLHEEPRTGHAAVAWNRPSE
jgi:SAM-dependent methyltransferase